MEPSPVPYNLRSRGRVVGDRLLRRQGLQPDNSSGKKHHHRRRPKPRKPLPVDPLVVERERKAHIAGTLYHCKKFYPHPFLAMRHYNKNLKQEDRYKVSEVIGYENRYYPKVGIVHLLYFKARLKSLENLPNPPDDVHFLGRLHELPGGETHLSDCRLTEPLTYTPLTKLIPVHCGVCHLENEAEFESKSRKLREEAKAQNLSEYETPAEFPIKSYHDYGFSDSD